VLRGHLNVDVNPLSWLVYSRHLMGFSVNSSWRLIIPGIGAPGVAADTAFAAVELVLHLEASTEELVVVVIDRGVEAVAPHGGSAGRLVQTGVTRHHCADHGQRSHDLNI